MLLTTMPMLLALASLTTALPRRRYHGNIILLPFDVGAFNFDTRLPPSNF